MNSLRFNSERQRAVSAAAEAGEAASGKGRGRASSPEDTEPEVAWNAAIGLARYLKDGSGGALLHEMLDRTQMEKQTEDARYSRVVTSQMSMVPKASPAAMCWPFGWKDRQW